MTSSRIFQKCSAKHCFLKLLFFQSKFAEMDCRVDDHPSTLFSALDGEKIAH